MIVGTLPPKFERNLNTFVSEVASLLGGNLKSILLHGSAARGEFDTKRSKLDVLIVLGSVEYKDLALMAPRTRTWRKKGITTPLVMSPEYIRTALDVYPLEFLEMKSAYRVLHGDDALKDVSPPLEAIRRQCEQEARGKLLHLRQILLETELKPKYLKEAILLSVPTFIRIARHVNYLHRKSYPGGTAALFRELRETERLDLKNIEKAWAIRGATAEVSKGEVAGFFEGYLSDALALVRHIDSLAAK